MPQWYTNEEIVIALNQEFISDQVYIVDPGLCSTGSPLQDSKHIYKYLEAINGYYDSDNIYHPNGYIRNGSLDKPVVMIINTDSLPEQQIAEANARLQAGLEPEIEGGKHWICCVILPKQYQFNSNIVKNENEKIIFIDSLNVVTLDQANLFLQQFTRECSYQYNTETRAIIKRIPTFSSNAEIVEPIYSAQQQDGWSCGIWAVNNALQIVATGNLQYLNQQSLDVKAKDQLYRRKLVQNVTKIFEKLSIDNGAILEEPHLSPKKLFSEELTELKKSFSIRKQNSYDRLSVHYDDSSDEEDTQEKRKKYDFIAQINKFIKSHIFLQNQQVYVLSPIVLQARLFNYQNFATKYTLSFMTHVIGQQIFYSPAVDQEYLSLKQSQLSNNFSENFQIELLECLMKSVRKTIEDCFLDRHIYDMNRYENIHAYIVNDFYYTNNQAIKNITKSLFDKLQSILRSNKDKNKNALLHDEAVSIYNLIDAYLQNELLKNIDENYLFEKGYLKPAIALSNNFINSTHMKEGWLELEVQEHVFAILEIHGCYASAKKENLTPDHNKKSTIQNNYNVLGKRYQNNSYPNLEWHVLYAHQRIVIQYNFSDIDFVNEQIINFTQAYLEDLIILESARGDNSIIQNRMIMPNADWENSILENWERVLDIYTPMTLSSLCTKFQLNFDDSNIDDLLYKYIDSEMIKFERQVLSQNYSFIYTNDYSIVAFIANLRLCNRSTKRDIKNDVDIPLLINDKKIFYRSTIFPASKSAILEKQEITTLKKRNDLVENLGSYQDILQTIYQIVELINLKSSEKKVNDKEIAFWIRSIINGEKLSSLHYFNSNQQISLHMKEQKCIVDLLANITYLLFGTEVVRNPASLIHHQMMLDIILAPNNLVQVRKKILGKKISQPFHLSFADFLDDQKGVLLLPMQMTIGNDQIGAVKCARTLHKKYSELLPYPYSYAGDEVDDSKQKLYEFINREGSLVEKWFKLCYGHTVYNDQTFYNMAANSEQNFSKEMQILQNACKQWYPDITVERLLNQNNGFEIQKVKASSLQTR